MAAKVENYVVKGGDKNTKFFHRVANARRRVNTISRLEVEGVVLEEEEAIRLAVEKFYKELYVELHSFRPTRHSVSFESIPTEMCDWLERPFEEEEVGSGGDAWRQGPRSGRIHHRLL